MAKQLGQYVHSPAVEYMTILGSKGIVMLACYARAGRLAVSGILKISAVVDRAHNKELSISYREGLQNRPPDTFKVTRISAFVSFSNPWEVR